MIGGLLRGSGSAAQVAALMSGPTKSKAARLLQGFRTARPNAAMSTVLGAPSLTVGAANTTAAGAGTGGGGTAFTSPVTLDPLATVSGLPIIRHLGGGVGQFFAAPNTFGNKKGAAIIPNSTAPVPNGFGFELATNANLIDVLVRNTGDATSGAKLMVKVDDEWVSTVPTALVAPGDGNQYPVTLRLPTVKRRRVRWFFNVFAEIMAIRLPQNFYCLPWSQHEEAALLRVLVGGDSWTWHSGTGTPRGSWAHQMGEAFGPTVDVVPIGVGGMGYVNAIEGKTAIDVLRAMSALGYDPAAVVLAFGINDNDKTAAQVHANAKACWTLASTLFPGTPLVCIGPWSAPGRVVPAAIADAVRLGFLHAVGHLPYAVYLDPFEAPQPWNSTSDADFQADRQHPTDAFALRLGLEQVAPALAGWLESL